MSCDVFKNQPDAYFNSYENMQVHRIMLEDKSRLDAYKNAILSSRNIFKGSVVMDVGAGTGILSLFCAFAGAKKVYAVEASSLATVTSNVVEENDYSDVIEVLHQKVEDVCLPNGVKVDIIVSEWMGFYLLHESMLDSVIVARDKFLKPNGMMFPDNAVLYAAPCSCPASLLTQIQKEKEFWADVSGFQMKSVFREITKERFKTPDVSTLVQESDLLSSGIKLFTFNLNKVTTGDLDVLETQKFISVDRDGEYGGVCIWFDCEFPNHSESNLKTGGSALGADASTQNEESKIILSTSPFTASTHWKQTLILWPPHSNGGTSNIGSEGADGNVETDQETIDASHLWKVENGEVIGFNIRLQRDISYPRRYAIHIEALDPVEVDHPVPCECGTARCTVIAAFLQQCEQQNEVSDDSSFSSDGECDVDQT